ncbi:MAG: DUF4197 domain-containing protein [Saprospiraceae bacterium]|nr:DUF4197 domain-containing protein [Saprospiraceae bacterium]
MKKGILYSLLLLFGFSSCDAQLGKLLKQAGLGELSTEDVVAGLKEALGNGTSKGSDLLSAKDGFYKSIYKIALPPDAKAVADKLRIVPGFDKVEENVVEKMNRAAEDAAIKAKPIFISAIRQMTVADAWGILKGEKDAATQYLIRTTRSTLYSEFKPVVIESLNKFGAIDYWSTAVNAYNQIPLVKKANPDISDHVVNLALDALFKTIAIEEKNIRINLSARTSDLLKRVFSKQDP